MAWDWSVDKPLSEPMMTHNNNTYDHHVAQVSQQDMKIK